MDLFDIAVASKLAGGGGGGGSSYKLLASGEVTFNANPSTAQTSVGTLSLGSEGYTGYKLIYVKVRLDTTETLSSQYYGSDWWIANNYAVNGFTDATAAAMRVGINYNTSATKKWSVLGASGNSPSGIFPNTIQSDGTLSMSVKYNSSFYSFIGTYTYEVYALDWPDNISPFYPQ